jgi:hypothetical protein
MEFSKDDSNRLAQNGGFGRGLSQPVRSSPPPTRATFGIRNSNVCRRPLTKTIRTVLLLRLAGCNRPPEPGDRPDLDTAFADLWPVSDGDRLKHDTFRSAYRTLIRNIRELL